MCNIATLENKPLPIINIKWGNYILSALVDSGSSCNLVDSKFVNNCKFKNVQNPIIVKSLMGGEVSIDKQVKLSLNIDKATYVDIFNVVPCNLSSTFQLILGVPFLKKFNFSIDFLNDVIRNNDVVVHFGNHGGDLVNSVSQNLNKIPVFTKRKHIIPPNSEKIIELYSKTNFNDNSDFVFIMPDNFPIAQSVLMGYSTCKKDSLFVKILNLGEESFHLNKHKRLGVMERAVSLDTEHSNETVNHLDEIGQIDHTDLQWSANIDLSHLDDNLKVRLQNFLKENSDVFASSVLDLPGCDTVLHTLKLTDDTPVKSSAYRVPYSLRDEMDRQINLLVEAKILIPSNSPYSSPVILVKKADGGYRLACDFRKLNKKLVADAYPLPNITETIDSLSGAKYFSTLDLTSGFFQQMIPESQQHITSIIIHRGSFSWSRSPFGLLSSPSAFQRLMNCVLGDLSTFNILLYLDDICIASKDIESHFEKLNLVFERLREHNLRLKPSKCHFLKSKIKFLGFQISDGKVCPADKNVEVVKNFKKPSSRKQVRSFLGCLNFYRRCIPDLAKRSIALTNLTKEKNKFVWNQQAEKEFLDLKDSLARIPSLFLPDMKREFILYTDSSSTALGAVLAQFDKNNFPCPVAFASRKLKDVESRYSATERELLAVVWAINYFKCYLYNNKFTVFTDHAALTNSLKMSNPPSRIGRWLTAIADYTFDIKYIRGKCNTVADFLSRFVEYEVDKIEEVANYVEVDRNVNFVNTDVNSNSVVNNNINSIHQDTCASEVIREDINHLNLADNIEAKNNNNVLICDSEMLISEIREAQLSDKFCSNILNRLSKDLNVRPKSMVFFIENELLMCKRKKPKNRREMNAKIVLPRALIPKIFNLTHSSAAACHSGFFKTLERTKSTYFWPGMLVDIKKLIKTCQSCLEFRAHKPKMLADMQKLQVPDLPFAVVHCDVSGPYPVTLKGNKYIIAFVDSFSKWPEAYSVPSITSDFIAEALTKFICRHGCPKILITDRGSNFLSKAIGIVYQRLAIKHIPTTAYRPQSNAKVERQHSTMNSALAHLVNSSHTNWDDNLDLAMLAIRTGVHSSTNETPFFITTGRDARLPYDVLAMEHPVNYNDTPSYCENLVSNLSNVYKQVKRNLEDVAEKQVQLRSKVSKDKNIKINDLVMLFTPIVKPNLSKKFMKCNTGPYRVIKKNWSCKLYNTSQQWKCNKNKVSCSLLNRPH